MYFMGPLEHSRKFCVALWRTWAINCGWKVPGLFWTNNVVVLAIVIVKKVNNCLYKPHANCLARYLGISKLMLKEE
jgi:hypothetical protein